MKGEGLSFVAVSGCHGAYRPYLVGVMEMLMCPIKGSQGDFSCYFSRICCGECSEFFKLQQFYLFIFWLHLEAFGILVPWTGIEPAPPAVAAWSLTHGVTRKVPKLNSFKAEIL